MSASQNIWDAVEKGNIDRVKYLIEFENINVNSKNPNSVIK